MKHIPPNIQGLLPRRRRRFWRYVSGRRRSVALLLFSAIVLGLAGWWYFTNDHRVERKAEQYLRRMTGAEVRIREARFRLFEGIQLTGVRVFFRRNGREENIFTAREVYLRHRPLSLASRGRLEVGEIICVEPVVTRTEYVDRQSWNLLELRMFSGAGDPGSAGGSPGDLPTVRLRDGAIICNEVSDGVTLPVGRIESIDGVLRPRLDNGGYEYEVTVAGEGRPQVIRGHYDMEEGVNHLEQGSSLLRQLDPALPRRYRQWRRKYQLTGSIHVTGRAGAEPDTQQWTIELDGASIRLPEAEGGLTLDRLHGQIVLTADGVEVRDLTGRLVEAGGATFACGGSYMGYAPDSPLRMQVVCDDLAFPMEVTGQGRLSQLLRQVQQQLAPEGPAEVSAEIRREQGGQVAVTGAIRPRQMAVTVERFPYRFERITGAIGFSAEAITLEELRAHHDATELLIQGELTHLNDCPAGRVRATVTGLGLDDDLLAALVAAGEPATQPASAPVEDDCDRLTGGSATRDQAGGKNLGQALWDTLSPAGVCNLELDLSRESQPDAEWQSELAVIFDGRASMSYVDFPYRLEELTGRMVMAGGSIRLHDLRGRHGPAGATINGWVDDLSQRWPALHLEIEGVDVPLRADLGEAMAADSMGPASEVYASFHFAGEDARANISATIDRPEPDVMPRYDIRATIQNARLRYDYFPYPLRDVTAMVAIDSDEVVLDRFSARAGTRGALTGSGRVDIRHRPVGLDLEFAGTNIELNDDLGQALRVVGTGLTSAQAAEQEVQSPTGKVWDLVNPSGLTDLAITLSRPGGQPDADVDYELDLTPRDATVRYRPFPYPVRSIQGRVHAVPGRVELLQLQGGSAVTPITASGVITTGPDGDQADLTITAQAVPIDRELIESLPETIGGVLSNIEPGGEVDLELRRVVFTREPDPEATTQPAETTAAATAPSEAEPEAPNATRAGGDEAIEIVTATQLAATGPAGADEDHLGDPNLVFWGIDGRIAFREAHLGLGLGAEQMTGWVDGRINANGVGGDLAIDAAVALEQLQFRDRLLQSIGARLLKQADSDELRVAEINGEAYQGRLTGEAMVALDAPGRYGLDVTIEDVHLDGLVNATEADPNRHVQGAGRMTGRLQLTGQLDDPNIARGTGRVEIIEASIVRLPVVIGLLQTVWLQLPGDAAYTRGAVEYHLQGPVLTFDQVYLQGGASLLGNGTMNLDSGALRMLFVSGPPQQVPQVIRLLSDLVNTTGLTRFDVSGTLRNPQIDSQSLQDVQAFIQEMVSPQSP